MTGYNTRKANGKLCQKIAPRGLFRGFVRYCATRGFSLLLALLISFGSVLVSTSTTFAATNSTVNFQARILQSSGALVDDGDYSVEFKIYDSSNVGGTGQGVCSLNSSTDDCWWLETRTGANTVRVVNGYVSVNLGSVTPFGSTIPWDQDLYITMRVGGIGAPVWDVTEMVNPVTGRMKMSATPYSKVSGSLKTTSGANSTTVGFATPTGTNTITFGDGSGLVCLNNGNCNTTAGGYLLFGSSTIQNGTTATTPLLGANQQGAGSLLDLQTSGVSKFAIGNDGLTTIASGVKISNTTSAVAGTLRWNGADFEGFDGTSWKSLTANTAVTPFASKTKIADEIQNSAVNATATLQNDDHLFFAIGANETWNYRFVLIANANVTPDIKFAVTAPAGATCKVNVIDAEGAVAVGNLGCGVSSGLITGNTTEDLYEVVGSITNGATAGNVTLQWAQNTANAANVIVRQGSYLEAQRSVGTGSAPEAFVQGGNTLGATAVLGTNDNNALTIVTNGTEKLRVDSAGNVGIGDTTPAALFTVGTADAFQVNASGNILTSGTLSVTGTTTLSGNLVANRTVTGTTGTTTGTGTNTTTLNLVADVFAVNDVVLIDNVGQDYYTRITVDPGTGSYTVSPAVTFEATRTVTKYNVQNIGATSTDYVSQANRFFQGYFLGGIVVGAGSTTFSDGKIERTTGNIDLVPGSGGAVNVGGTLNVTAITGDGSGITNISGASISGSSITGIDASNISTGTLNDARLSTNVDLLNGAQTFSALKTFGAGASITAGQSLSVNGDAFTDLTGTGLQISSGSLGVVFGSTAGTSVEGNTTVTCASGTGNLSGGGNAITLGSGGTCGAITTNTAVSFSTSVTSPIYTGTGAVSLSSGGSSDLTLDSASNILVLSDATLRRTASGTTTLELNDTASTNFAITNNDATAVANLNVEGGITASTFSGSGASLTSLSASNISTGTLNDAQLSSNVALLNLSQTFSALKTFGAGASITTGQALTINGDAFTDLTGTGLAITSGSLGVVYGSTSGTSVQGNTSVSVSAGTGLTGGSTLTLGSGGTATLNVAYGSTASTAVEGNTILTCASGTGNLTGGGNAITLGSGGSCGAISTNNAVSFSTSVTTPSLLSSAALSIGSGGANTISIDTGLASGITIGGANANSLTLGNATTATSINGTTIVLGSSTVRRTASGTTNYEFNDTANTTLNIRNTDVTAVANVTVEGAFTAASIAGSGSGITALDAGNVSAGTLADSRLTSNVATLSGAQTFTGTKTFSTGAIVTTGQTLTINGEAFSDLSGTGLVLSGGTLAIDTTYFNANYIQLGAAALQTDSSTNATIGINKTGATGNILTLQKNGAGVFSVGNTGAVTITNTSTSAFSVSGATLTFSIDSSGNIVRIGPATADATGTVFVLDTKNTTGDPTGGSAVNGAQYYNSFSNKFRCFENGAWADCVSPVVMVKKTSNEPKTNNAGLATDTTLQFAMLANTTYAIECRVFFDTANAPDFKYATVGPAAPTSVRTVRSHIIPGTVAPVDGVDLAATASTAVVGTGTTGGYVTLETVWQNGANAGTWGFQWAQNTANAATTTVLAGSQCSYSIR